MRGFLAKRSAVLDWLRALGQAGEVCFPQPFGQRSYRFERIRRHSPLAFEDFEAGPGDKPFRASTCVQPPGRLLAPDGERIFTFDRDADGDYRLTPILDTRPRILAGVRPCDLKAIHLMDRVHADGIPDAHYLARREHTTIIAHDCLLPCDRFCFCEAAGSLRWREGADVFLTPQPGSQLLVEALTERGDRLLAGTDFTPCGDIEARRRLAEEKRASPFGRHFDAPLAEVIEAAGNNWESEVWDRHVERCFGCGTCNLVCPTCYCFDLRDDFHVEDPDSGQRTRHWDGCMLQDFAEVAGGHDFRPGLAARQRHRIKRKLAWLPARFGEGSFCVGCGRCGHQCTVHIDIFDIANDLLAETEAAP